MTSSSGPRVAEREQRERKRRPARASAKKERKKTERAGGRASERGERASARAKTPVRSVDATGQKLDASDHLGNIAEPSAYSLLGGEVAPVLWR